MKTGTRIYRGSVKTVYHGQNDDFNYFEFSDRYSLFDWGEMPDQLAGKGEALCLMGALFFKYLGEQGIRHHFRHQTNNVGEFLEFGPSRWMKVDHIQVIRPALNGDQYDYQVYQARPVNCLVPLEVMFRFGAGRGSSLIKRVQQDAGILTDLGLRGIEEGAYLKKPVIDFSTKLEAGDRYLRYQQAREIAGLNDIEFARLTELTTTIAFKLQSLMEKMGLKLWDGKIEVAFSDGDEAGRNFVLVDTIGLDELRLEVGGKPLSKEFLRDFYRTSDWYKALQEAKRLSKESGQDFKELCRDRWKQGPLPLPFRTKIQTEALYQSFTNDLAYHVIGKRLYGPHLTVEHWMGEYS